MNLSAKQVANTIGAAVSTVTALERGEKPKVNADFIEEAARLFRVRADLLVWTPDPENIPEALGAFLKREKLDKSIDPVALAALATHRTNDGREVTVNGYASLYEEIRDRPPYVGPLG